MNALAGQVAIITGGGSGIGRESAMALAGAGACVALVGRREERLQETAALIGSKNALCCPCDVTDRLAVSAVVAQVLESFGRIDILVNNAGTNVTNRATATTEPDAFDRVVAVNLTGAFNMTQAVLETMRGQQSGLVINVSSIAGIRASALVGPAYAASKHGMAAMVNVLADEEQANGIRATAICPGEVNTEIIMTRPEPPSEERLQAMLQPEDVAAAVLFVASLPPRAAVPMLVIKPQYQRFV